MPKTQVTQVTVSHVWDDGSCSDIEIRALECEENGSHVLISGPCDSVILHPDSWPEIRRQIDSMFQVIAKEQEG